MFSAIGIPTLPILGSAERFPIRRIFCVGQNYAEHAREMGSDPDRQTPFFFSKPADAIVESGQTISYPPKTGRLEHEVELVLCLGDGGTDMSVDHAEAAIFGYAAGLDLTRRDLQIAAKEGGRPWDMAKGFDASAPVGAIQEGLPPPRGSIRLDINGETRQQGDLDQMIWSPVEIIAELSGFVALRAGDLVFTGTPARVGPIAIGDLLEAYVEGAPSLAIRIGPRT
jgi:fumarylpyruvate hydrolase